MCKVTLWWLLLPEQEGWEGPGCCCVPLVLLAALPESSYPPDRTRRLTGLCIARHKSRLLDNIVTPNTSIYSQTSMFPNSRPSTF